MLNLFPQYADTSPARPAREEKIAAVAREPVHLPAPASFLLASYF